MSADRLVHPLRPLYRGLLLHPLLLLVALLFTAIAWEWWGAFTRDYGVSDVFWHDFWWTQLVNGFAVTLLLGQICFVAYLRDMERDWLEREQVPGADTPAQRLMRWLIPDPPSADPAEAPYWAKLRWYLLATWAPLLALVTVAPAVLDPVRRWPLPLGALAALVWTGVAVRLFHRLRQRFAGRTVPSERVASWGAHEGARARVVTRLFVALFACYALTIALCLFNVKPATADDPAVALKDTPAGYAIIVVLILAALALVVALAVVGVGSELLRLAILPPAERWRHTVAAFSFGFAFAEFVLTAVVSGLWPWGEHVLMYYLVPPTVGLCLLITLLVIVDNTLRFHFHGAYIPAWFALIGLSVLANSFEDRRLHFPGLKYPEREKDVLQPADLDPRGDGSAADARRLWRECDVLCTRLGKVGEKRPRFPEALTGKEEAGELARKYGELKTLREQLLRDMDADDTRVLDEWKKAVSASGADKPKLVVVATVGGANRAALWTVVALTGLEQKLPDFPRHVRVITGASGGMVGASYYAATLNERGTHERPKAVTGGDPIPLEQQQMLDEVAADHLTPVFHRAIFRDLPLLFWPFRYEGDRGRALEEAWDRNMGKVLDVSFPDLEEGERAGWRPTLIVTPMLVEDGRQLYISNAYLPYMTENGGSYVPECDAGRAPAPAPSGRQRAEAVNVKREPLRPDDLPGRGGAIRTRFSLSGLEFFQLFPDAEQPFRLRTAARMNASFPYVSPAVDLPLRPRRRVVDAGYYDNYGVKTAAAWLDHNADWLLKNTSGVVLIQLRDAASEDRRLAPGDTAADAEMKDASNWDWSRGVEWLTAPAQAVASAREAVMSFRNDEHLETLDYYFNEEHKKKDFFTTVVLAFPDETAVNWYLSPAVKERIKAGWPGNPTGGDARLKRVQDANAAALERLECWWKADHSR